MHFLIPLALDTFSENFHIVIQLCKLSAANVRIVVLELLDTYLLFCSQFLIHNFHCLSLSKFHIEDGALASPLTIADPRPWIHQILVLN